jgi:dTDP-4-dehydrorhamnose reductase
MKKILLVGAKGQVGWELQRTLAPLGQVIALSKNDLDLSNNAQILKQIRFHAPEIIVNAAAYTAVDKAESEPDLAMQINGIAPGIMAEEAEAIGALFVHFSTDYVFDGRSSMPYNEDDLPNPLNVYGKSKLLGEDHIKAIGERHLILRTSWVYGTRGHNFLNTMLKLSDSKSELNVVSDQVGAPTWSRQLAECTALALFALDFREDHEALYGTYHLSSSGATSWHGFAQEIFKCLHKKMLLNPISSGEYTSAAKRPANSLLSNAKFNTTFGIAMPSWEHSLRLCLEDIAQ